MNIERVFLQFNLLSLVMLFLVTAIHFRYNHAGSLTSKLTTLFLFSVFYATLVPNLILTGTIVHFPHLYRTGTILGLLASPLMYLITSTAMTGRRLRWYDAWHLAPVVLYVVNFFPLFIMGTEEKLTIIQAKTTASAIYSLSEGWLLGGKAMGDMRILQILFYLGITVRRMIVHKNELDQWNDEEFNWRPVILQLLLFVSFYLVPFMVDLSGWFGDSNVDKLQVSFALANMVLVVFFLSNPELLYGFKVLKAVSAGQSASNGPTQDNRLEVVAEANLPGLISDKAGERVTRRITRIRQHLEETKSFLSPDFGLSTLEKELGISGKSISQTIKDGTGMNFSAFINDLRISHVLEQLHGDMAWRNYTVETLAAQAGYRSPTSFYNNFKDKTGKTPREYIESLSEVSA